MRIVKRDGLDRLKGECQNLLTVIVLTYLQIKLSPWVFTTVTINPLLNIVNLLINIKDSLKMWNFRELTLAGKIQIFKSLALSKAVYVCTMTSPSRQFLDQINLLKRDFIWAGKSSKVKHSILIGSYAEGGYKNVDIEFKLKSLKIIWIKRLLDDNRPFPNSIMKLRPRLISHQHASNKGVKSLNRCFQS